MTRATPARHAALAVLRRVAGGDLADRAFDAETRHLPPRERAWVHELAYGTLRLRGRLDLLLAARVRGGLQRLEPVVLDVLRLGAYQLLEMGSVPPYAAVSQAVELAREAGAARAAGLVNGVLQALRRAGAPQPPHGDALQVLSGWGSHPAWLVERWLARWGEPETTALVEANNRRPELYLRPLGVEAEDALRRLHEAGIAAEPMPHFPDSLRLPPPTGAAEALAAVPAVVQDPAAAAVVRYAAVPPGAPVLDVCAAPGGKALGLAERAGYVAAADLSLRRLQRVRENAQRLEMAGRLGLVVADARQPPFRPAAALLLDAPCTGTGTLRRHPDGRWRVQPADLQALVALQREILGASAGCVQPGGLLVYATCSLEAEENEAQVDDFLERHPEFRLEPSPADIDASLLDEQGRLSVLPQRAGVDGAFAARLRRAA